VELGGEKALEEACQYLGVEPGEVTKDGSFMIEEVPCLCLCDLAPAALVGEVPVAYIDPSNPKVWMKTPTEAPYGFVAGEPRWLTGRCGEISPTDIVAFEDREGFAGIRRALGAMKPEEVVEEIKASGLVGRGGAAFPAGLKWQFAASASGEIRYVVCNGDESEPGTYKDRVLMEGDPLFILEGMLIAGYSIGAKQGFIYVRGEYPRAQRILSEAIAVAKEAGYLGNDILGSGFSFDVELRSGAGAYVCGEETALFESIEGKRGFPRLKPPYPTTHGLFNKPTVINNVETLCAAAWIIANGADVYHSEGTEESPGVKMFCVSGDVIQPGVYEVPFGTTMERLIDMAGGVKGDLKALLLGGAAGAFASPDQIHLEMSFEALRDAGLPLGSGVVMVANEERDLRQTLLSLAKFFAHESCGKCFPCQLGTQRQLEIMQKLTGGEMTETDLEILQDIGFAMTNTSICGLGMTAGTAILSAFEKFPALMH
jgi:NADH-quinone oxidoreductase subunit F